MSKPGSYLFASLRSPVVPVDGEEWEANLQSSWLGSSLCRREVALTEDSSSYKISAFRCSCMLAAAAVWKYLLSTVTHGLNFHHEKPVTPLAHAVAPHISCLLMVALKFLLLKLVIPSTSWKCVSCMHSWWCTAFYELWSTNWPNWMGRRHFCALLVSSSISLVLKGDCSDLFQLEALESGYRRGS